ILWSGLGVAAIASIVGGAWILSLPPAQAVAAMPPIEREEAAATIEALKPPKRHRPLIAIIGINDATETTDYLMPYGILRRADVADVVALATEPGPVRLYPALRIEPQSTVAGFDAQHPQGADYVIVPAMSRDDDPIALRWIKSQAAKGATIIGVCAGAKILGSAGLLDGRRATTHWYYIQDLRDTYPELLYVKDRRLVVDRGIATTTGISASMPMSLTLIEAIAGPEKAKTIARDLGIAHWDARHDSDAFRFTRPFAWTAMQNALAFWNREHHGIELVAGIDEVALALVADAWSRTFRSRAVTFSGSADAQPSRSGLRILPDETAAAWPADRWLRIGNASRPAEALEAALRAIAARYGTATAKLVAMQLELPRRSADFAEWQSSGLPAP
ncbi:MAG: DJ-1/PfpI family protein, partial [Phyllobacterium sp.]